jgi:hypothetical protein
MFEECLDGVLGTGWLVTTGFRKPGGDDPLVDSDRDNQNPYQYEPDPPDQKKVVKSRAGFAWFFHGG